MLFNQHRQLLEAIEKLEKEIHQMSSTVNAGLAALQQADSDLAAAVTANTTATQEALADIQTLTAELASNEDLAVQTIAADLESKISALQASTAALAAAVTPPAAPSSAAQKS
jgi:chromosome segregation ATPase